MPLETKVISIIGLSKNAGKTTVLGALLRSLPPQVPIGLVSIGVDGEERDAWSGREKPSIEVPQSGWIATAEMYINQNPGQWEIISHTGLSSTAGAIYLVKAKRPGRTVLAGVVTKEGIERVIQLMREYGCRFVLVDGAYDRKASSSPFLSDQVIAVVGASMGKNLKEVCHRFAEFYALICIPSCTDNLGIQAIERSIQNRCLVGVFDGEIREYPDSSIWRWKEKEVKEPIETMAYFGALTDRGLTALRSLKGLKKIIVPDFTHLFISKDALRRFQAQGGQIQVLRNTQLSMVAVNPISPDGYAFPPDVMKKSIQQICPTVPVWDVVRDREGEIWDALR